jgi:hypothetical protein
MGQTIADITVTVKIVTIESAIQSSIAEHIAPPGRVTIEPALYPPTALPLIDTWGPALEHLGGRIARDWGAFNVMTISRSTTP